MYKSKFILKAGSRWSIGDGTTISVWNNKWIVGGISLIPQFDNNSPLADLCVSDCINQHHKTWNIPFLSSIFDKKLIAAITNTPLYTSIHNDQIIWTKEETGAYSVRSPYRLCMQELLDTNHFNVSGSWDLLWRLEIPPKVKNFIWRLCRNCIPTRTRLRDKGVNCQTNCVLCDSAEEDNMHLFFNCPSFQNVLSMCPYYPTISNSVTHGTHISKVIFKLLQVLSAETAAVVSCVLWSIWQQRNNQLWEDKIDPQSFVFARAESMLCDWKAARKARQVTTSKMPKMINVNWKRPTEGRFKCNIDASFSSHLNKVGIGMCIRDDTGAFVLAKTEWFSPICEVHIGEALGILSTLSWAHELNLGPMEFELDSKKVVDRIKSVKFDTTEFGAIISHCKALLSQYYENSNVEFVRRQANEFAHVLAKEASLSASFQILVDTPSCIEHILSNEML